MDVFAAMRESLALLRRQQFQQVVDRCVPVLDAHPHYVPLRLLLAQALLGLRRWSEAQANLRFCLDLDPECGTAHRLLGDIELRRNHPRSAARLLDEACRLSPGDREARDLLLVVERQLRDSAEAPVQVPSGPRHVRGTSDPSARRRRSAAAQPRASARRKLARGTDTPGLAPRPATLRDGFGDYLAEIGVLSRAQVRAALIYRRTRGVGLGEAAVALGFVSAPKLRWAAQAYFASSGHDD